MQRPDSRLATVFRPSPNHGERIGVAVPNAIVLHYTGMADGASALAWLRDPASQVSCHYLVEEDGGIVQLVGEARRAWHAGQAIWQGKSDLNSSSVGIEIVNGGHNFGLPPYPPAQIEAVTALCRDIAARHGIGADRILAHSDIAPGRKQDPGELFPWDRLYEGGIGVWVPERQGGAPGLRPGDAGPEVGDLQADLAEIGYGLEPSGRYDAPTRIVVEAFQRHFRRSRVDGVADGGTRATLADLIAARRSLIAARSQSPTGA